MQSSENSHNTEASPKDMADSQEEIKIPGATNDATIQTGEITNAQPDLEHLLKEAEIKAAEDSQWGAGDLADRRPGGRENP